LLRSGIVPRAGGSAPLYFLEMGFSAGLTEFIFGWTWTTSTNALFLENIPFLELPKLLLSTKDLGSLQLQKVPQLG
jgi:hypothetical protein